MRIKTFQIGETVRIHRSQSFGGDQVGIIVKKLVTQLTGTELYDVLLEDGELVTKLPQDIKFVVIRQDGVEVNG
jgi:hypothetical protein